MIAGAACAITAATAYAVPHAFIFFGMLHAIAVASVLGLAFLRAPVWLILGAALAVWFLPGFASSPAFDTRWLAWTGLAATPPASFDFVPVAPMGQVSGPASARSRPGRSSARSPGPAATVSRSTSSTSPCSSGSSGSSPARAGDFAALGLNDVAQKRNFIALASAAA
jgi:uncharacterized membrane protein